MKIGAKQIALMLKKEGLKPPGKHLNKEAREERFLSARFPLAWKVKHGAIKGWREPSGGGYTVRPFKGSGENRYNKEGAWALARQEAPIKR